MIISERRSGPPWKAVVGRLCSAVSSLGLGYLAVVPLLLVHYVIHNSLFAALGWVEPDTKFAREGPLFQWVVAVAPTVVLLLVFLAVNLVVSRVFAVSGRWYWTTACLLAAMPLTLALIEPSFWTAVRWY
ncbi:hypothetical protein [Saccharothrix australiensis]|uniref:Uncharacterized protein n=1 Tax=Saccharothrix australiensis TaxID=2072 RepID=A0A495VYI0_9PSEU|nr:hypothetical protein [Saccharothrix australiensis]RKT54264.1 hypothetical protein C8E97_2880 [Saccharothrix australiensis]